MSNPLPDYDDAAAWERRFRRATVVLVAAALLAVGTPLLGEARYRAGVVRRVRIARTTLRTRPTPTARLDVPFLRQEHALSCEAATLRMALAYRGVAVSEAELIGKIGTDPTPRRRVSKNIPGTFSGDIFVWGDPDEAFVGDVDGIMSKTGYGVHARPIARVAGEYRAVEVLEAATPAALASEITSGNPVITWGFIPGRGKSMTWRTLGGREVRAVDGEHTRVVIGYTGTTEQPTGFIVIDPIYGEQYWATEKFVRNLAPLGQIAVVIQ